MPRGVRRTAFATVVASIVALTATTGAYAGSGGFLLPSPHSPNAHRIQDAYVFVAIFCGVIFLIVEAALITFVIKYRRGRRRAHREGPQIHGSTKLEIALDRRAPS